MSTKTTSKLILTPVFTILAMTLFGATIGKGAPGDLDTTFGVGGTFRMANWNNSISDIAIQPDGKTVAVGQGGTIIRFNQNGMLDSSFGTNGTLIIQLGPNWANPYIRSVAVQADGKIVVVGGSYNAGTLGFAVVRCNPDGTPDTTFNGTGYIIHPIGNQYGVAWSVAIQTEGKIVFAGSVQNADGTYSAVFRYNPNGTPDTSFNGTGSLLTPDSGAYSVAIQPDGKIVVVGYSLGAGPGRGLTTFRYNGNGSPDASFGGGTGRVSVPDLFDTSPDGPTGYGYQLAIQPDGRIVVLGQLIADFPGDYYSYRSLIIRYDPNGSRDTTFGINGIMDAPLDRDVAIQPDGKILAVGTSNSDSAVARYKPYGTADTTFFGEGMVTTNFGANDWAVAVAIQADGKIVVAGHRYQADIANLNFVVARYHGGSLANAHTPFDFDGDSRADVSVFRPSDRTWYLNQSTNGFVATPFGLSTDKLVPANYDGDGKTDIAVFRDGTWYWLNSFSNTIGTRQFGFASDIPVPANYSFGGPGLCELAVYRDGTWWIRNRVTDQETTIEFGLATDKPVPADYDGDGRTDLAVYRNGEWHLNRSTQGYGVVHWGLATDKPVPADYDGDGKTDLAVYRDGTWYILQSLNGWAQYSWGIADDVPVPADYDGDGRTDAAVFRNGTWYITQSSNGAVRYQQFGLSGDIPAAGANQ